jgi:hypothetical protein
MSDIDLNSNIECLFVTGIKDDYVIFDNKVTLYLTHDYNKQLDYTTGVLDSDPIKILIEGCIYRGLANRNSQSVRQFKDRDGAVQIDNIDKYDVVIEVPVSDKYTINDGDTLYDPQLKKKWRVCAIDFTTLASRIRLGCTDFK